MTESEKLALWEKAHERNANRIVKLIIQMEGMWVKMGQYFSVRADGLPGAYPRLLKQLQDSLPPRCLKEVSTLWQYLSILKRYSRDSFSLTNSQTNIHYLLFWK